MLPPLIKRYSVMCPYCYGVMIKLGLANTSYGIYDNYYLYNKLSVYTYPYGKEYRFNLNIAEYEYRNEIKYWSNYQLLESKYPYEIEYWSDGYIAGYQSIAIEFERCKICKKYFRPIYNIYNGIIPLCDKPLEFISEPTEYDYYKALDQLSITDLKIENRIRILAWWRRNNIYRGHYWKLRHYKKLKNYQQIQKRKKIESKYKKCPDLLKACRHNLLILINLINSEDEYGIIMKAEIYRELGEFDIAINLLRDYVLNCCDLINLNNNFNNSFCGPINNKNTIFIKKLIIAIQIWKLCNMLFWFSVNWTNPILV
jgi:hypothetical protein